MNIVISAKQGAGKTTAARIVATGYLNATSWNGACIFVFEVHASTLLLTPEMLAQAFHDSDAHVVMFDGCLVGPEELLRATKAVNAYRRLYEAGYTPRPLLAIFVESQETPCVYLQFDKP